jgi:hypothetical protein
VKKGRGNGVVRALGETRDEFDAFWIDGPTGTNSDDDEAHTGGKITILLTARARGDSQVSRKARTIGVIGSDVCWASSVKGLDVNQEMGACPVIITKDDVGGMANPGANALHPLVDRTLATKASTLSGDSRVTGCKEVETVKWGGRSGSKCHFHIVQVGRVLGFVENAPSVSIS